MNSAAQELGKKGGVATKKRHGVDHYKKMGILSGKKRKKKAKK